MQLILQFHNYSCKSQTSCETWGCVLLERRIRWPRLFMVICSFLPRLCPSCILVPVPQPALTLFILLSLPAVFPDPFPVEPHHPPSPNKSFTLSSRLHVTGSTRCCVWSCWQNSCDRLGLPFSFFFFKKKKKTSCKKMPPHIKYLPTISQLTCSLCFALKPPVLSFNTKIYS